MTTTRSFSGLNWVRGELDEELRRARDALEEYVESGGESAVLGPCISHIHKVQGVLGMLQLQGPVRLADEMQTSAELLQNEQTPNAEEAAEALMLSMIQLPDYLEKLEAGGEDIPRVLLPAINDLRTSRGAQPLSEMDLVIAGLAHASDPVQSVDDEGNRELRRLAHQLRPRLHKSLLSWFRDQDSQPGLHGLCDVFSALERQAGGSAVLRSVFRTAHGVIEGLLEKSIEPDKRVKGLVGRVDRVIRSLEKGGVTGAVAELPQDVITELLSVLSRTVSDNPVIVALKADFDLVHTVPSDEDLAEASRRMLAPGADALTGIRAAAKKELMPIKDTLDLYMRGGRQQADQLSELADPMRRLAATLEMAGLAELGELLRGRGNDIKAISEGRTGADDALLMRIAGDLLIVESALENEPLRSRDDGRSTQEEGFPRGEIEVLIRRTLEESSVELAKVKEAIVGYMDNPSDSRPLEALPTHFHRVAGALRLISHAAAADLLDRTSDYIEARLRQRGEAPEPAVLDALADSITGIEYYMEAVGENRRDVDEILEIPRAALEKLTQEQSIWAGDVPTTGEETAEGGDVQSAEDAVQPETGPIADKAGLPEIDPEILEIFLEEANEELENIQTYFRRWKKDQDDTESLGTFRRSFHTLKGSGRLAGALVIGDYAWAVENLLNRVMDQTLPASDRVVDYLEDAIDALPELIAAQEEGRDANVDVEGLIGRAETMLAAPAEDSDLVGEEGDSEPLAEELVPAGEQLSLEDSELLEIFGAEAHEHLGVLRNFLGQADSDSPPVVNDEVVRSLHTLAGSARMAGLEPIAVVAKALERKTNPLAEAGERPDKILIGLLAEGVGAIGVMVASLETPGSTVPSTESLLHRIETYEPGAEEADAELPSFDDEVGEEIALEDLEGLDVMQGLGAPEEPEFESPGAAGGDLEALSPTIGDDELQSLDIGDVEESLAIAEDLSSQDEAEAEVVEDDISLEATGMDYGLLAEPEVGIDSDLLLREHESGMGLEGGLETDELSLEDSTEPDSIEFTEVGLDDSESIELTDLVAADSDLGELDAEASAAELPLDLESVDSTPIVLEESEPVEPELADLSDAGLEESGVLDLSGIELDERELATPEEERETVATDEPVTEGPDYLTELELEETESEDSGLVEPSEFAQPEPREEREIEEVFATATSLPAGFDGESAEALEVVDIDPELREIFLEEAQELLEQLDAGLGDLTLQPEHLDISGRLQRTLHTLKGSARLAGIESVGNLAHALETLLSGLAESRKVAEPRLLDLAQQALDTLSGQVDAVRDQAPLSRAESLVESLESFRSEVEQTPSVELEEETEADEEILLSEEKAEPLSADEELAEIFLEEAQELLDQLDTRLREWEQGAEESASPQEVKRLLHTLKGSARLAGITSIGDLSHSLETLLEDMTPEQLRAHASLLPLAQRAADRLLTQTEEVRQGGPVHHAAALIAELEYVHAELQSDETEPGADVSKAASVEPAPVELPEQEGELPVIRRQVVSEQVRVRSDLLNRLINNAGEISIYRARLEQQNTALGFNLGELEQTVSRLHDQLRQMDIETEAQILYRYEREHEDERMEEADFDPLELDRFSTIQQLSRSLIETVNDLVSIRNLLDDQQKESETLLLQHSRISNDLQDGLLRTRMVPFSQLVPRLHRLVRQTASTLGKRAVLEVVGAEGEMDRSILDRMLAPIEHILRNAVSHGIEAPAKRREDGKSETGKVSIYLSREGNDVVITVSDDGAGLNLAAIRSKAEQIGLLEKGAKVDDDDIMQLVLEPGFSTVKQVTQISGRGVGTDVVVSEVKQLGGSLDIDSQPGRGTSFSIRLPFTLAISDALLVAMGDDMYAVPHPNMEGLVRISGDELARCYSGEQPYFQYAGHNYQVRYLGNLLGSGAPQLQEGRKWYPLLLVRSGEHRVAIQVDQVLGTRQIVVKSVGAQISTVRWISGGTILADGRVALILDVSALVRVHMVHAASAAADSTMVEFKEEDIKPVQVMVVDDSITVRKVTSRLLKRHNMEVITAKDGVDAVAQMRDMRPDVMLLDIEMPRMDGYEVARHMRSSDELKDIPIIMITSRSGEKHRNLALSLGVSRYLGKPYQEGDLLDNIYAVLAEAEAGA